MLREKRNRKIARRAGTPSVFIKQPVKNVHIMSIVTFRGDIMGSTRYIMSMGEY